MAAHTRCKNTGKNAVDLRFANSREFLGAFVSKKTVYLPPESPAGPRRVDEPQHARARQPGKEVQGGFVRGIRPITLFNTL